MKKKNNGSEDQAQSEDRARYAKMTKEERLQAFKRTDSTSSPASGRQSAA
jgi:hypothetical protein